MLRALGATHGATVRYAGLEEKLAWADKLVARGDLPPDVVRFALFGVEPCRYTSGANRNALLLDTVGELTLSVDDDTVCRIAVRPGGGRDGLAVTSDRDPAEYWFFPDRETALASVAVCRAGRPGHSRAAARESVAGLLRRLRRPRAAPRVHGRRPSASAGDWTASRDGGRHVQRPDR